jgi:hypothetical protein
MKRREFTGLLSGAALTIDVETRPLLSRISSERPVLKSSVACFEFY